eukprot:114514-Rhodomonas_salina.1
MPVTAEEYDEPQRRAAARPLSHRAQAQQGQPLAHVDTEAMQPWRSGETAQRRGTGRVVKPHSHRHRQSEAA